MKIRIKSLTFFSKIKLFCALFTLLAIVIGGVLFYFLYIVPSKEKVSASTVSSSQGSNIKGESVDVISPTNDETIDPISPTNDESVNPILPSNDETIDPIPPTNDESVNPILPSNDESAVSIPPTNSEPDEEQSNPPDVTPPVRPVADQRVAKKIAAADSFANIHFLSIPNVQKESAINARHDSSALAGS